MVAAGLFFALRDEVREAWPALRGVHPVALLALPLFLAWNQLATLSWQRLLGALGVRPPLTDLVRFRIEAQAVNQVVPAAGLAGEALRVARAAGPGQVGSASTATALDNAAGTLSGLLFASGAVLLHSSARRGALGSVPAAALAIVLVLAAVALPFWLAPRIVRRFPGRLVNDLFGAFVERPREVRRAFQQAVALRLGERVLGAGEIYVAFHATGYPVSAWDAALVAAALVLVSFLAFFLPGQLGAAEATGAAVASLIGLPAAAGLSAVLVRRARQLVVCAVGGASLLFRARAVHAH